MGVVANSRRGLAYKLATTFAFIPPVASFPSRLLLPNSARIAHRYQAFITSFLPQAREVCCKHKYFAWCVPRGTRRRDQHLQHSRHYACNLCDIAQGMRRMKASILQTISTACERSACSAGVLHAGRSMHTGPHSHAKSRRRGPIVRLKYKTFIE
jgi:hypothetical protein